jgi:hypothetical protein
MTEHAFHLMIDLETLSTRADAAILAIGAVEFDPWTPGLVRGQFYTVVDLGSSIANGLKVDGGTFDWWLQQSDEARAAIYKVENKQPIHNALISLGEFILTRRPTIVWCHGLNFDIPVLQTAYRNAGMKHPWKYNAVRDTRTLYEVTGVWPKSDSYPQLTAHNALSDAIRQAYDVQEAYRAINRVVNALEPEPKDQPCQGTPFKDPTFGERRVPRFDDAVTERPLPPNWFKEAVSPFLETGRHEHRHFHLPPGSTLSRVGDVESITVSAQPPSGRVSVNAPIPTDAPQCDEDFHHNDSAHGAEFPMPRARDFPKVG